MLPHFYEKMQSIMQRTERVVLMVVVAHEGSSPGRSGFKMAVSKNEMLGTIGGGIMEHKLVEYARSLLEKPSFEPFVKKQIHDKSAPADQSGMICSGWQTIAFYDLNTESLELLIGQFSYADSIHYNNTGVSPTKGDTKPYAWEFSESTLPINTVYVIGGGHVGLALCEVLSRLDFEIHLLDHRENLNTMQANIFADHKQVVVFEEIDRFIPEGDSVYVVIMSFGYRTDDIIIRQLLGRKYKYIGLMGSREKIKTLYENLHADGFFQADIDKVHAPIGIDIKSETAAEIAISVAAELIAVKNQQ